MKKQKIVTKGAPNVMEHHVHPVCPRLESWRLSLRWWYSRGGPRDGKMVDGDIKVQARRCFETMKAILEEAGTSMDNVIKVTVLFVNFDDKHRFEEIYGEYFPKDKPVRTSAAVSYLGKDILMEIDAIAHM